MAYSGPYPPVPPGKRLIFRMGSRDSKTGVYIQYSRPRPMLIDDDGSNDEKAN